jgi:hypothetical protein
MLIDIFPAAHCDKQTSQSVLSLSSFSHCISGIQENIQADRDDPSQPLVTAPFGHASQV